MSKPHRQTSFSESRALSAASVAALLLCAFLSAWAPAASQAARRAPRLLPAHSVKLTATLSPERLGFQTTIRIGFQVSTPVDRAPSPVTAVRLLLPAGLAIATSDLGLETCEPAKLQREGLTGCPVDSLMGRGSAAAEVPFGSGFVTEQAPVSLFSGPLRDGHPQLLFAAEGEYPVLASIVFAALLLPARAPFGGALTAQLPLVPSVRDGPDLALVRLQTTIGAKGIVYTEPVKGKMISFRPRGIVLPEHCPRGGFRFAAHLSFQDGTHASATTAVPCPQRR